MSNPSLEEIGKSIESGTKKALKTYEEMSGDPAWYVPEFFVQSHIALDLKDKCDYVSLEEKVSDIREAKNIRGRPPKDDKRRYDIFIWSEEESDAGIAVEIKRVSKGWACNNDAEKLERAIKKKWADSGIIIAYAIVEEEDKEEIGKWFDKIHGNIKEICGEDINVEKFPHKNPEKLGDDYWSVAWFEMRDASSETIQSIRVRGGK